MLTTKEIQEQFDSISKLGDNWDEMGAVAPSPVALYKARTFLSTLDEPPYHVYPGPNGEVCLMHKYRNREVETIFYPDRTVKVIYPKQSK